MICFRRLYGVLCCLVGLALGMLLESPESFAVDFDREIEPILQSHCVDCHGPEEQEGGFRVDRRARLLRGGGSGEPAVVPEQPDSSYLLKLIRHEVAEYQMPPDGKLEDSEIAMLARWISEGAITPERYGPDEESHELSHWSFMPVERPNAGSIDELVEQRRLQSGLEGSQRAERATLIRRLFLVVLGVPPTPDEVRLFVEDQEDHAWERLVDDVLGRPLYGERLASLWLDLIRFGETHGYEMNRERPTAWPFRDWVINSFNNDLPYDQFVRFQIAGDAFGTPIGTGFLVAGPVDQVKGQDPKLRQVQRMNELDDMINTTGTAFLGLTTGCARCHDHKFDPISQTDYYSLQAVFAGVNHADGKLALSEDQKKRLTEISDESDRLNELLRRFLPPERTGGFVLAMDETDAVALKESQGVAGDVSEINPFSLGGYTWWNHQSGEDLLRYEPRLRGKFRVWISWGAGFSTHSTDARYLIRSDKGELEIARVNQQLRSDGSGGVDQMKRWSGFFDAGVHALEPDDVLLLRGGDTGSAVTADAIVFEEVLNEDVSDFASEGFSQRPSVSAKINTETFLSRDAKAVRFWIDASNQSEACIDELEVFSGDVNVALSSSGGVATSSGDFVHPTHRLSQINDGEFGNSKSWISSQLAGGWVQIEFPHPISIDRIQWGRDRQAKFSDRTAIGYRIELLDAAGQWEVIASSSDRRTFDQAMPRSPEYQFERFADEEARNGRQWLSSLNDLVTERKRLEASRVAYIGQFSQPGPTHRLYRGEPGSPREQVAPGAIEALTQWQLDQSSSEQARRTQLAQWISDPENPLTARVIVNRIWQFHFGEGFVDTPSDFGRNGSPPTHPKLLDWLASELVQSGWSLKHVHRLILLSNTWCQDNAPDANALRVDASNRLLWRFAPRRLEAEPIRDSMLAVTGVLDLRHPGGPGFSAFEVQMENVRHYHPKETYGPSDWRRMIYMTKVRQEKDQVFGVFDCPDSSMVVPKRSRSTTPLQALNLLNSTFVLQQAGLLAKRLEKEEPEPWRRVVRAWEVCFQRRPTEEETSSSLTFVAKHGWGPFARALLNTNEFVFIP